MQYGTTFAFVSQPGALTVAPCTAAIYEVEYRRTVLLIELFCFCEACFHNLVVPWRVLLPVRCCVAYQRVVEILPLCPAEAVTASAVDIAQVVDFEHAHQFFDLCLVFQDGGHDDHGGVLFGNEAVFEFQFESASRMVKLAQQPVEKVYHHLAHRQPHDDGEQNGNPREFLAHGAA